MEKAWIYVFIGMFLVRLISQFMSIGHAFNIGLRAVMPRLT